MYQNRITYTVQDQLDNMLREYTALLRRRKALTVTGAQRILRRQYDDRPDLFVLRVEPMLEA